jgi:putative membrane-bound dehydrogenase-like protein
MSIVCLALALALLGADPKPADRPIPPKDAAKAMTVPDGFKVTLFAGEPDVVQPIAFTFDDRGRMWVVECLSYPNWRHDGKGNDRVVILEDTDGDGVHDKKTVFLDNGVNLSGIELGFGGVWLCSSPNLLFVPILEGDKPGKPEIKLDGWNIKDTKHNIFNSLGWGPDGWLYGLNGIQAKAWVGAPGTPQDKRTYIDCGVWRYHPTRKVFEAVAHGTTNPFGLDWDEYGEMFITNCVIDHLFHIVPGGHYERMYGQDANPHVYGLMKSCVDYKHWAGGDWTSSRSTGVGGDPKHSDFGGGHAHSGCAIYIGDNFPPEYRNTLFTANIHGNRLNNDGLERTKSGYKGVRRKDFLFANDSWFRGICVKLGPEGALYVSDWCDTGECHNYDKADTTNGRIYRVSYGDPKPWKGDVSKLSDKDLVRMQLHKSDWFVRHARRVLQERAAEGVLENETTDALRTIEKNNKDVPHRLRALWALHAIGGLTQSSLIDMLGDGEDHVRVWASWLVAESPGDGKNLRAPLVARAKSETSPFVRLGLASAACKMSRSSDRSMSAAAGVLAVALCIRGEGEDRGGMLSCMYWNALVAAMPGGESSFFGVMSASKNPIIRRQAARFWLTNGSKTMAWRPLDLLVRVIGGIKDDDAHQADLLAGIAEALEGKGHPPEPVDWRQLYPDLSRSRSPEVRLRAEALSVMFGSKPVVDELKARIPNPQAPAEARARAIELLARNRHGDLPAILQSLLADAAVRGPALRALAVYSHAATPTAILKEYANFTESEKADAVMTLASRRTYAGALLDAIEKGTVPRSDVSILAARQILALNDKALAGRLEKVWGKITPASKERAALMKKWKEVLSEGTLAKADATRGRVLFTKHCASCHKMFGEGQAVGPELTGSQRTNLDYVLENVLDPSAVVPNEFRLINFTTTDDRVVSGIVLRETKDAVTVRTANDTVILSTADIAARKQTNVSIMPDGLFDQMKPDEVRDLISYLRSKEQVPLPK